MEFNNIIFEDGPVARITFNRPERRNALSLATYKELHQVMDQLELNKYLRVLIVTGTGKAFCAGADINELLEASGSIEAAWDRTTTTHGFLEKLGGLSVPVIAALNGDAVGAGASVALACDIRIAAETARIGVSHLRVGMCPDMGISYFLPRLVGTAKACELSFLADVIDAREAERIGLVNRVVPDDQLEKTAQDIAMRISRGPALAMAIAKRSIYDNATRDLKAALKVDMQSVSLCATSSDCKEGLSAFLEKRPARFPSSVED